MIDIAYRFFQHPTKIKNDDDDFFMMNGLANLNNIS